MAPLNSQYLMKRNRIEVNPKNIQKKMFSFLNVTQNYLNDLNILIKDHLGPLDEKLRN
jgi:hypothetical protein